MTHKTKVLRRIHSLYIKNKQLIDNIAGTYLIKGGSLFISFLTMPAYLRYFSDQNVLGIWFTIISMLQWILTFDLGIGNGLRNKLVPALIKDDKVAIKKYISSAYIGIGVLSLFAMVIGCFLIISGSWNTLLNISSEVVSNKVLKTVLVILFTGILFQFFFKLIISILFAMQKTAISNLLSLISSVLILIYVLIFKTGDIQTDLVNLAIVNILIVNIPLIVATGIVFSTKLKDARPSIGYYEKDFAFSIVKLGGKFFVIQLAVLFINSTNEILITYLYSPEYVVEYRIYSQLFLLVATLFSLITNPVWAAITTAYVNAEYHWIGKVTKTLILIAFMLIICNIFLAMVSQFVINFWLGDTTIVINYLYTTIFVLFSAVSVFNIAWSCIANAIDLLKCQAICFVIGAIIKIPFAILLSRVLINDTWITIVIVNIIVLLPYAIIQPGLLNKFCKNKLILSGKFI